MRGKVGLGLAALVAAMSLGAGVAQANVAPRITAPARIAGTEDLSLPLSGFQLADADADRDSSDDEESVTLSVDSGRLLSPWGSVETPSAGPRLTLHGSLDWLEWALDTGLVSYQPVPDFNGSVALHVTLDDEGHTGGGRLTAATDVILDLAPVNDAPEVNHNQGSWAEVDQDHSFTSPSLLEVTDVDGPGSPERVTLTVTHGTLTLPATDGLTFSAGDGDGDTTMTFEGGLDVIGAALARLVFRPDAGYTGDAVVSATVDDLGNNGAGGPRTGSGQSWIDVQAPVPSVEGVDAWSAGTSRTTFGFRDVVFVQVQFSRAVTVSPGSHPELLLNTTPSPRRAAYYDGSGSRFLTFQYQVEPGDFASILDVASPSALQMEDGAITSLTSGIPARATLPTGTAEGSLGQRRYMVDADIPFATNVETPPNGLYAPGDALDFKVHFTKPVLVTDPGDGHPPQLQLGGSGRAATLVAGGGTDTLTFRHVVVAGESTGGGGIVVASRITPGAARLTNALGTDAYATWDAEIGLPGVHVDGVAPTATGLARTGDMVWTLSFDEPVHGVDPGDFDVVGTGTARAGTVVVEAVDAATYRVTLRDTSGAGTVAPRLRSTGTGIADAAGNGLREGATGTGWGVAAIRPAFIPPLGSSALPVARPRPRLRTATIASSCTRAKTLTLALAGTRVARVEARVARLRTTAKQRGCSGLSALRTGRTVGAAKRLTLKSGTNHITYRHGLRPGAYVVTFTPIAADGTRGTAVSRRIRILK